MKRSVLLSLPLALAVILGACGDDPAGPGGSGFDPVAVHQALDGVYDNLDDDSDVLVGIDLASGALSGFSGAAAVVGGHLSKPRFAPSVAAARAFLPAGTAAAVAPIFPSNVLGKTLVWNPETDAYEIDEALTGAPANGVRFRLYAIEPVTRRPVEPLVDVGHLDLIDESGAESLRIVVQAVIGGATLVDYFIDGSFSAAATTLTVTALGVGYISDGTHRLDFDLEQSATFTEGSQAVAFTVGHSLAVELEDVAVTVTGTVVVDFETETLVSAEFTLTIEDGADRVVFSAQATEETLDGAIRYNGDVVILVGGTPDDPTFTGPDGSDLTAVEVEALLDLVDLVEDIFDFAENLFHPFVELSG